MSTGPITVGEITAAPGQRARGFLSVEVGKGLSVRMPVVIINGKADGPVFAVTAGVHGAEYPGIEAAIRLSRTLDPAEVRGALLIVPVVSVPAYQRRAIYVNPLDGINFNRVCPGNPMGTVTEMMADLLFKNVIAQADYYMDLHGGDMIEALVPFTLYYKTGNEAVDAKSRALAEAYGIPIILGSTVLRGGTYGAAAAMGKPSVLTEAGGQGILDEPSAQTHMRGVLNVLRRFGGLPGQPEAVPVAEYYSRFVWLTAEQDCVYYPKVTVGQQVREGELIAEFTDLFGEKIGELKSPATGPVLFLVTSPAINKNDPLMAIGSR
ncbi:MAG: M14 family metallopeptidase [candidate division NC10 bacterium]|nr:M14 family metallopeptidase [candidate division NC10 bacterium]